MNMEIGLFFTIIGSAIAIITFIYQFFRNLKADINSHIDRVDSDIKSMQKEWKEESKRMDLRVTETNKRMDGVYHLLLKRFEPKSDP